MIPARRKKKKKNAKEREKKEKNTHTKHFCEFFLTDKIKKN